MFLKRFIVKCRVYPSQLWLMLFGMLISTMGGSMIWPFLTIYVSEKLEISLTKVAALLALRGGVALFSSFIAGNITDRFGRKWIMVVSLAGHGLTYFFLGQANSYLAFAILLALRGFFTPLYKVGSDTMVTDLVPEKQRADAFALMRMSDNIGIAMGPAIGGFIATRSYTISFTIAASTLILFSLLITFFTKETSPNTEESADKNMASLRGYLQIAQDRTFLRFSFSFMLLGICSMILWVFLAVYAKTNFQVPESQYGLIPTTNALMVVLFQVMMTRRTKKHLPLPVMAIGALIYGLGVGSVALGTGFGSFWLSFVIVTIGEIMVMPTASTFVATVAPLSMRGRYMGVHMLSQGIAASIAPILGGLLNDNLGPSAIWYGGGLLGVLSALSFAQLAYEQKRFHPRGPQTQPDIH